MDKRLSAIQFYLLLALLSLFITSVWSYGAFMDMEQENRRIVEEAIPISNAASELFPILLDQELTVRSYTNDQDPRSLLQYQQSQKTLDQAIGQIERLDRNHPIMQQIIRQEALPLIDQMKVFYDSQVALVMEGDFGQANVRRYDGVGNINEFREVDKKIRSDIAKIIREASERGKKASDSAKWMILIVGGVAVVILMAFVHSFQLERSKRVLVQRSLTDPLTKIANRRAFDEDMEVRWRVARTEQYRAALILIDVDSFKAYNDTYGHLSGDSCLIAVARTLKKELQDDGMVYRYGGEEFAVLLDHKRTEQAVMIGERLRQAVIRLDILHETSLPLRKVSISAGVAVLTPGAEKESVLIEMADQALYRSKEHGRNRVTADVS
ncbi:diguanylate cyclase domain-containing protein [Exiguobacterium flavidum]|uniref:diguanylate cyclase domain-containing protein n=1 Tax=Exiguobacterium flavidum TaxID=2184695 RepID=UPI0018E4E237|nr:diguanylate cyclase [Exiguobacterium flavidum]